MKLLVCILIALYLIVEFLGALLSLAHTKNNKEYERQIINVAIPFTLLLAFIKFVGVLV